jgi:hypothetical protein
LSAAGQGLDLRIGGNRLRSSAGSTACQIFIRTAACHAISG